ncbi:MAG TPA: transcriptional regulator NrdR [Thermoanaerobaculia bacterium]|jgi:transcriptional repressor NrdR
MKCPFCGAGDDRVVDSRESREGEVIRRRRECVSCGRRFTSYETIEEIPYMVVKNDGRREVFDRKKLRAGLGKACEKRPVPPARLDAIVDEVEARLHDTEEHELPAKEIGAFVMDRLRELDKVAYVRFASVYRKFEDVDEFFRELRHLLERSEAGERRA